ncbi:ABC-F family ATP-binding cassette domain-containing protein [Liquorilactobacillus mali]|uniref:ABC transporter ATP-binding protein n=1 Tax=Liquorilactobacillus mali KCTC 3596 = DSM 20444 TaxID=1046596 RepID=J1F3U0_9LACO|nr:ABC-F family ATP-binding cassette domain-containing protein [Liquorilactobacillus mali]EJF00176.1 ABC transporter ATP-binding protein [Liquorilactobacillus mali KCTC 3596 = DSM 20444]KRN08645.1 ABC transporter ATP-binding protein [Liquorilactobacillus mali KCTC 3596 = DSM 20444]QFQ74181.1 ABC-F family ATP-binding cassette domain-containing protein [Liquorilactobacillus mali]
MILLQAQNVERLFGSDVLFEKVNLDVQDNSRIALVGRNGVGKSTLIKMIVGLQSPDNGQITKNKNMTIGYLAQDNGLNSTRSIYDEMLTVFDDLKKMEVKIHKLENEISSFDHSIQPQSKYEALLSNYDQLSHNFKEANGYGYESEIRAVLHGFKFYEKDFTTIIGTLSGGQKTRLALAKLLLEKNDLLILDEPTNHLDIQTLSWLEGYLQSYSGALLIISHDRYFLDKIAKEVYELTSSGTEHYQGNYSFYIEEKAKRFQQKMKQYEKQQEEIEKLEDFVARNIVRASTTKRAQSRRKQLEKIDRLERPTNGQQGPHFQFISNRQSGNIVLTVNNAFIGYESDPISGPIDIDLRKHQRMAIVGSNGVGKSTLLKSILNKIPLISGEYSFGANVDTGYYDQELKNLHANKSVLNELWDEHPTTPEKDIRSILGSFLFSGDDVKKVVHNLSGGEKARLLLTKLAFNHDNFLIFDEPTNHLDIDSKEVLEKALLDYDGTILFISHDRYFINKVATNVLEISENGSQLYLGDYDYYVDKKEEQFLLAQEKGQSEVTVAEKPEKNNYQLNKEQQRKERKLRREIEEIENQLEKLNTEEEEIQKQMTLPEVYSDPQKSTELQELLKKTQDKVTNLEDSWEEKSMKLENLD